MSKYVVTHLIQTLVSQNNILQAYIYIYIDNVIFALKVIDSRKYISGNIKAADACQNIKVNGSDVRVSTFSINIMDDLKVQKYDSIIVGLENSSRRIYVIIARVYFHYT